MADFHTAKNTPLTSQTIIEDMHYIIERTRFITRPMKSSDILLSPTDLDVMRENALLTLELSILDQ